jgi:hypothetical protein
MYLTYAFPVFYLWDSKNDPFLICNYMNNICSIAKQITTTHKHKQTTHTMKNANITIALLSSICFLLSLVLINLGEDMSNRGIVFMGLLSLSASAFILAFTVGEKVVSTFKK